MTKKSKKIVVLTVSFIFIFVVGGFLFFPGQLWAVIRNNNANVKNDLRCGDGDNNQYMCMVCGHKWISIGYKNAGNPNCCGDDLGEYSQLSPGAGLDTQWLGTSSFVCCDSSTDCVKDNKCYNEGAYKNLNPNGNDNFAVCSNIDSSWNVYDGVWYDCDFNWRYDLKLSACNTSICGSSSGVRAGELGVGEYSDTTTKECCGDDKNEFKKTGRDGTNACCNSRSDVVVNGKCYAKNKVPAVR